MEKILIVEDDAGISDFVNTELQHEGYKTCTAFDGRQALELFEKETPDLILLDIMIPQLSGLEVLRRIRKTSSVPVIILTARGETYDKVNGLNAGADDYIAKPFEIEELLARMGAVLRRSVHREAKSLPGRQPPGAAAIFFYAPAGKVPDKPPQSSQILQLQTTNFLLSPVPLQTVQSGSDYQGNLRLA